MTTPTAYSPVPDDGEVNPRLKILGKLERSDVASMLREWFAGYAEMHERYVGKPVPDDHEQRLLLEAADTITELVAACNAVLADRHTGGHGTSGLIMDQIREAVRKAEGKA